jgi:hypothetical protein
VEEKDVIVSDLREAKWARANVGKKWNKKYFLKDDVLYKHVIQPKVKYEEVPGYEAAVWPQAVAQAGHGPKFREIYQMMKKRNRDGEYRLDKRSLYGIIKAEEGKRTLTKSDIGRLWDLIKIRDFIVERRKECMR